MTTVTVFDPPMCCSSGVCGPRVDPQVVRFARDLHWLIEHGVRVERFNLAQQPQAFAANETITGMLASEGNGCLPVVLVNQQFASKGTYPSRQELAAAAGLGEQYASEAARSLPVVQG